MKSLLSLNGSAVWLTATLLATAVASDRTPAAERAAPAPDAAPNKVTFPEVGNPQGESFHVVVQWQNLKSIPGSHEIVAHVRQYGRDGLAKKATIQRFESGNRTQLVGVERRGDSVVLRFTSPGGAAVPGREVMEVRCIVNADGLRRLPDVEGESLELKGLPSCLRPQAEGRPGGVTSTYAAADGDMRLTAEATTAVPIAKAVKAYFATHSTYPPMTELQSLLKPSPVSSSRGGQINGWSYFPDSDKQGFSLTRKLGWDTALRYSWDGTSDEWYFEPGDGSASKKIDLRP